MSRPAARDPVPRVRDYAAREEGIGPLLFARGVIEGRLTLVALLVRRRDAEIPDLSNDRGTVAGETLETRRGMRVIRYTFSLPATLDAGYRLEGRYYPVNGSVDGDLRLAYVSCNGLEHGDRERSPDERNALWRRLAGEHAERPFQLLLHGGDQIYADEITGCHPRLRAWADDGAAAEPSGPFPDADVAVLRDYLFQRYLELYSQPAAAWLMARVPSLCMWDDHDICDGWGSLPTEDLDSAAGQALFRVARAYFLMFQLGATSTERPAICADSDGASLGWRLRLPGLSLVAPDLRSERRPRRVMGERGWRVFDDALREAAGEHLLVLSSVPALGPRLSWVERAMGLVPGMQKYEDDLRDQWQSRVHRAEWRRFLRALIRAREEQGAAVTVLSGEIHLATRGTMVTRAGPVHQLVASGIAHPPPPRGYATALGALARLGESPVAGHPIRLHPLPGRRGIYTAQRNYLVLERRDRRWQAWWELEEDGATGRLDLSG